MRENALLKLREQKLTDFVRNKHEELIKQARTRVADYLRAAHALRDQPSTEDFMLIAETNAQSSGCRTS